MVSEIESTLICFFKERKGAGWEAQKGFPAGRESVEVPLLVDVDWCLCGPWVHVEYPTRKR